MGLRYFHVEAWASVLHYCHSVKHRLQPGKVTSKDGLAFSTQARRGLWKAEGTQMENLFRGILLCSNSDVNVFSLFGIREDVASPHSPTSLTIAKNAIMRQRIRCHDGHLMSRILSRWESILAVKNNLKFMKICPISVVVPSKRWFLYPDSTMLWPVIWLF